MPADEAVQARRRGTGARLACLLLTLCAIAAFALARDFDPLAALGEHRSALLGIWESRPGTLIAFYVLAHVMVIVLSLPGAFAMTLTGGFLFGLLPGAVLSALSATAGGLAVFLLARTAFGDPVRRWLLSREGGGIFARAEAGLRENAVLYLLLLRLVPAVPFTVANVAPAFFGISPRLFVATTFIGVLPASAILASFGSGLAEAIDRGARADLALLGDPMLVGPLLGLAALGAVPLALRRLRGMRAAR